MANRTDSRSTALVMTRTPLRVSFAGGGTDLTDFYEPEPGAVFSTAINKYIYVTLKRHGECFQRVDPAELFEKRASPNDRRNRERHRAGMPAFSRHRAADLHQYGGGFAGFDGLGGSSSFAVGLLNALHAFRGERVSAGQLAEEACHIEIERSQAADRQTRSIRGGIRWS